MSSQRNLKIRSLQTRQFKQLIGSHQQLNKLYLHAKDIYALNEKLQNHLDPTLGSHCFIANYTAETLTINADTSAWASKLRNYIPDILHFSRHKCGLNELISICIKTSPNQDYTIQSNIASTRLTRKAFLSKKSARFIENVATSMTDPALREVILRISKNIA